jgi:hypothetical protein
MPGSAPDWDHLGTGLRSARVGDSIQLATYYSFQSGPAKISESITDEILLGGKAVDGPSTH